MAAPNRNPSSHLKKLEKEPMKSQVSRRIKTVTVRTETNTIETKTQEKSTEIKAWFSEKVGDSDDPVDTPMGEMQEDTDRILNALNSESLKEPRF